MYQLPHTNPETHPAKRRSSSFLYKQSCSFSSEVSESICCCMR